MNGVAVTGWSVHVPGLPAGTEFGGWAPGDACAPADAAGVLGRRGLLAKEPATRLALCAVHRALGLPAGARPPVAGPDPRTAVVASSNLGNVATVSAVARAVDESGVRAASPLDAPNVSSNVIASTVAIWFGFGGPNLMVCSGHPSGLDAVRLAQLLIAAGRADRVVVVGVEPDDDTATALFGGHPRLRAAAACVVLARAGSEAPTLSPVVDLDGPAWRPPLDAAVVAPGAPIDLTARIGTTYGALGVLQVAVAAALVAGGAPAAWVACGAPGDGYRAATLSRIGGPA